MKATKKSPPDNLTRWTITQSKGFTRKGIKQISRSVRVYDYSVLTSQVQAWSSIVGNSAPAVDAQKVFKSTKGYNNKILVSYTDMKIGSNRDTNKDRKKMPLTPQDDTPKIVIPAAQHEPSHNLKMLTEMCLK